MVGIELFDIFLYRTAEPHKPMCVALGSDQNSEFYRGANFFENVKISLVGLDMGFLQFGI